MNLISLVYFEHLLGEVNVEMNGPKTEVHLHLYLPASSLLTYALQTQANIYVYAKLKSIVEASLFHSN